MGYGTPMASEILWANIIPLILVDLIQIFFCSSSGFCTYSKFKSHLWEFGQDITESMWRQGMEKIRHMAGVKMLWTRSCHILGLWWRYAPLGTKPTCIMASCRWFYCSPPSQVLKPFSTGDWSPPASLWHMQQPGFILQKWSTSSPTGNLQTQLQPKDRQQDVHAVLCRVNNGCPTCCATKGEKKRIYRSLRQMRLLLMCFFACSFM